ncbi:16S rRNA (cytidine(1402)-2'-O)-methyltransferase [Falsochrobactrum shanghaiense]|uniref:Ribosomal RNA small subunit methyltransferase I n=1 Tax=Falsochrobactrum shanghaiense TaxID=2201899 RepID=A0A316JBR5_9HYPH|nr:16S rRNA (cytidine(1402)-2'-O)-methyltransferase [Falsochrobactrum shanghaiense]PWL19312.1 16S rRNA (cytidine(1402)-2'-O)-methyltransferase [Falsochrobactrum shanghaiense]
MTDFTDEAKREYVLGGAPMRARPLEPALYIVSTPIGNLGDMTLRGIETLASADILACEDTRVTRVLLDRYAISRRPVSYHEHNAAEAGPKLIAALSQGKSVALVSDAGTPLVSDPGFRLVGEAREAGIRVVPVPGASAVLAALAACGLPTDAFMFCGFLPVKHGQKRSKLESLKPIDATLVFYESPNRAAATLSDMVEVFGEDREGALCRELTKAYETIVTAPLGELARQFDGEDRIRGEVVLLVGPPLSEAIPQSAEDIDRLLLSLAQELPPSKAAGEAARMTGGQKSVLYQRLMQLKAGNE